MAKSVVFKDIAAVLKLRESQKKCFDGVLQKAEVLSLENGKCLAKLKVDEEHLNPYGYLHGGCSAAMVDTFSAFALMNKISGPHASIGINVNYLKSAKKGDNIIINGALTRLGKKIAFMEVQMKNADTGELIVFGTHTAVIV